MCTYIIIFMAQECCSLITYLCSTFYNNINTFIEFLKPFLTKPKYYMTIDF